MTVTTLLPGSPLWDVKSVGKLTPVVTGSSTTVIDHLSLHHNQGITEKKPCLSTENKIVATIYQNTLQPVGDALI